MVTYRILSSKITNKIRMPDITTSTQNCNEAPGYCNKARKKRVGIQKEEIKQTLFIDDLISHKGDFFLIDKTLELISEFSKISGHKVDTQNSTVLKTTSNKEKENKFLKID